MDYTGKKRFRVEHTPTYGEIDIEIDFDKVNDMGDFGKEVPILDSIKEMVLFFSDGESLIDDFDGDYVKAFLKNICEKILRLQIEYYVNEIGIIRLFEKQEGYLPIDGSYGIELLSLDEINTSDYSDYEIVEVK